MSQVLITGATGLVGGHLLRMLLNAPGVKSVAAPTRRPLADISGVFNPHDPQLTDALAQVVDPIDIVFCCLGTTRREAGSKEAFVHADYTLVIDTALVGKKLGAQHMLVVSAMGANAHSPFFYNRVKGEMEEALIAQQWPRLTIARPSMLIGEREKTRRRNALCADFQSAAGKSEVNRGAGRGERATRGGAIAHAGGRTNSLFVAAARKGGTLGGLLISKISPEA